MLKYFLIKNTMEVIYILLDNIYNVIVDNILSHWFIAVIVLVSTVIIAIPQLRDGLKTIFKLFKRKEKDLKIEYPDETITFDEKKISRYFDVVKIHATTHMYGVAAENKWLKKRYPKYKKNMQSLYRMRLDNGNELYFDKIDISKNTKGKTTDKTIWFDITDFFYGSTVPFKGESDKYAMDKIKELYS